MECPHQPTPLHDPLPKPFCEKLLTLGPQVGEITPEQLQLDLPCLGGGRGLIQGQLGTVTSEPVLLSLKGANKGFGRSLQSLPPGTLLFLDTGLG